MTKPFLFKKGSPYILVRQYGTFTAICGGSGACQSDRHKFCVQLRAIDSGTVIAACSYLVWVLRLRRYPDQPGSEGPAIIGGW
jgi:hypothetical protein